MARDLTGDMVAAIIAQVVRPVRFFEGVFADGTLRLWSGVGPITWDGETWLGAGHLGRIGPIEETAEVKAAGVRCEISGVSTANLATALAQVRLGAEGTIWEGCIDENNDVIADPAISFKGRLDICEESDDGETATIVLTYESRLAALERARERRLTPEDQKALYPADEGFDFVPSIQEWNGKWGRA